MRIRKEIASETHKYTSSLGSGGSKKENIGARRRRRSADVVVASANPERAWKELSVSSPEVVARISQAKREFATYQRSDGVFSRPRGGHPTADGMS